MRVTLVAHDQNGDRKERSLDGDNYETLRDQLLPVPEGWMPAFLYVDR